MTDCVPGFITLLLSRGSVESSKVLKDIMKDVEFEEEKDEVIIIGFDVKNTTYKPAGKFEWRSAPLKPTDGPATDPRKRKSIGAQVPAGNPVSTAPTVDVVSTAPCVVIQARQAERTVVQVQPSPPYSETSSLSAQSYAVQAEAPVPSKDEVIARLLAADESWNM